MRLTSLCMFVYVKRSNIVLCPPMLAGDEGSSGSDDEAEEATPKPRKKRKPTKAAVSPVVAAAAPEPTTDVSAWDVFGLHPGIQRALAAQVSNTADVVILGSIVRFRRGRDLIGQRHVLRFAVRIGAISDCCTSRRHLWGSSQVQ